MVVTASTENRFGSSFDAYASSTSSSPARGNHGADSSMPVNPLNVAPQALPASPQEEEIQECPICLESLDGPAQGEIPLSADLTKTKCNHLFHKFCLQDLMIQRKPCPLCRAPLDQRNICHLVKDATDNVLAGVGRVGSAAWKIAKLGVESIINTSRCGCYDDIPVASDDIFLSSV